MLLASHSSRVASSRPQLNPWYGIPVWPAIEKAHWLIAGLIVTRDNSSASADALKLLTPIAFARRDERLHRLVRRYARVHVVARPVEQHEVDVVEAEHVKVVLNVVRGVLFCQA